MKFGLLSEARRGKEKEVLGSQHTMSTVSCTSKQEVSCQEFERKDLCSPQKAAYFSLLRALLFDSLEACVISSTTKELYPFHLICRINHYFESK